MISRYSNPISSQKRTSGEAKRVGREGSRFEIPSRLESKLSIRPSETRRESDCRRRLETNDRRDREREGVRANVLYTAGPQDGP